MLEILFFELFFEFYNDKENLNLSFNPNYKKKNRNQNLSHQPPKNYARLNPSFSHQTLRKQADPQKAAFQQQSEIA